MTTPLRRRFRMVTSAAIVAVSVAGCGGDEPQPTADNPGGVIISRGEDTSPYLGAEPASPYVMPDITLKDTSGEPFNLVTDTVPPITLVFFGYTHCPDVCSLVMSDLAVSFLRLPDDVREQTQMLYITTDPARDTPSVIRAYLDHFDEDFIGLTGDLVNIVSAAGTLGVAIEGKDRLPGGGYAVGHGAQVIGFYHDESPVIWTEGTPVNEIVEDVTELAGS